MNCQLLKQAQELTSAIAGLIQHQYSGSSDAMNDLQHVVDEAFELDGIISATIAKSEQLDDLKSLITGMTVSMDVSTGEHDAHHRYFGVVGEVIEYPESRHGVTLMVYDAVPNF